MKFELEEGMVILEKTPKILELLLSDLSDPWIKNNEGPGTWSPFDIIGHLIHGEKTDWIPRAKILLSNAKNKNFVTFDRTAQFKNSNGKTISELLREFSTLRKRNITTLQSWNLTGEELELKGIHPELGMVTLKALLSTWVVHDLGHINQLCRVMAGNYTKEVGPWINYLGVLNPNAQ